MLFLSPPDALRILNPSSAFEAAFSSSRRSENGIVVISADEPNHQDECLFQKRRPFFPARPFFSGEFLRRDALAVASDFRSFDFPLFSA